MIEADLENLCGGGIARDVAAELAVSGVRAHDHRQRIPANDRRDARLDVDVAGKCAPAFRAGSCSDRARRAATSGTTPRSFALRSSADRRNSARSPPATAKDGFERVQPIGGLGWIRVADRRRILDGQARIDPLEHVVTPLPMRRIIAMRQPNILPKILCEVRHFRHMCQMGRNATA